MDVTALPDERIFDKYVSMLMCENLPFSEVEYKQKDVKLEEIEFIVNNLSGFTSKFSNDFSRGHIVSKLAELIVGLGLVYKIDNDDRDVGPEDFPYTAERAVNCFHYLKQLLNDVNNLEHGQKRNFLINTVLLSATHCTSESWSNDASVNESKEFMENLLQCTQHQNLSSLLTDDSFHPTIFKGALKKMRPYLLKDTWMLYPSSCHVFIWLLRYVKHPYLVDYLSDILPPAFMFVSYYKPVQQKIGILSFYHILDNVPQSLMKLDGKEDAIYHSLFPLTYSKEPSIVEVLFHCLLKLPMMKPQNTKLVFWDEFDKVFNNLLFTTAMENNLNLKKIFLIQVLAFCEHTPPFKHLKRLMDIVKQTIENQILLDVFCRISALKILKCIIKSCWPRMSNYCFKVLVFILELQENKTNLSKSKPGAIEEMDQLCEECILLLQYACREKFETVTAHFVEDCQDLSESKFLRNVIEKNSC